jgi:hypothetical protein
MHGTQFSGRPGNTARFALSHLRIIRSTTLKFTPDSQTMQILESLVLLEYRTSLGPAMMLQVGRHDSKSAKSLWLLVKRISSKFASL